MLVKFPEVQPACITDRPTNWCKFREKKFTLTAENSMCMTNSATDIGPSQLEDNWKEIQSYIQKPLDV